jgi:hypothetical protein
MAHRTSFFRMVWGSVFKKEDGRRAYRLREAFNIREAGFVLKSWGGEGCLSSEIAG